MQVPVLEPPQVSAGWRDSPSSKSPPPEESEGVGHHLTESFVDSTDVKPTVKDIAWILWITSQSCEFGLKTDQRELQRAPRPKEGTSELGPTDCLALTFYYVACVFWSEAVWLPTYITLHWSQAVRWEKGQRQKQTGWKESAAWEKRIALPDLLGPGAGNMWEPGRFNVAEFKLSSKLRFAILDVSNISAGNYHIFLL